MNDNVRFPTSSNGADSREPSGDYPGGYPSAGAFQGEGEHGFSLHDILEVLFKHKWLILATFVVVFGAVTYYTLHQDPVYQAASTIYINKSESGGQLGTVLGARGLQNSRIANEVEILKSRRIALRVAEKLLDVQTVPGTDQVLPVVRSEDGVAEPLQVASRLQGRINARPLSREVEIVKISSSSTVPEEAALIANTYAEEFLEYNRESSRSRVSASREFLSEVTDRFNKELKTAEDELTAFLRQESVVAPDEQATQLLQQMSQLQSSQYQTQMELGMAQAEVRALEEQINEIVPGLARRITSGDDRVMQSLMEKIAQLEFEAEQRYARNPQLRADPSADPQLVQIENELEQLRQQLDERAQRMVEGIIESGGATGTTEGGSDLGALADLRRQIIQKKIQASGLRERLDMIQQQIDQTEARLSDIPRKDVIMNRLQRSLQTREQLYVTLIEKLQEARIAEQSELGYVDIVDRAILPGSPVSPKVPRNLASGAVLGLLLGLGFAFVRNALDNKVRKPEDLQRRGFSVISVVPDMARIVKQDFKGQDRVTIDGTAYSTRLITLLNPMSPAAEGYRRMRTNIQYSRPGEELRSLLVTSANPSEGKTVTALNLAVVMAQSGKRTLFVDADLRRPNGHRYMGQSREPGLVDLLFNSAPERVAEFATDIDDYLHVLPVGREVPNPAEVLGSRKMQQYLDRWQREFDVVIVDTPPALVVSDALVLSPQCDATLLVCAAGETSWQALNQSREALGSVGSNVLGVVLNRFDPQDAYGGYKHGYGYGYAYNYYNQYHYGQESSRSKRRDALRRL